MSDHDSKPLLPIDPKDLAPAGVGFVVGILIIVAFLGLAVVMGLPTIVEAWDIPNH